MTTGAPVHSKLGASIASRWMNCPGSVALCATVPPAPESPYAREGKVAHRLAELCLTAGYEPEDFVGRLIEGFEVQPEMAEAVRVYVDHVRAVAQQYPEKIVAVEQRVQITGYADDLYGTCDCSIYVPPARKLYVKDYKHGAGVPVEVENNTQCKYYALGALIAAPGPVDTVSITVVQPRCAQSGDPVRTWELPAGELYDFGLELSAAVEATKDPNAPLVPGTWCRFCPASGVCPKLYDDAMTAAGVEFSGDVAGPPSDIGALSSVELGRRLNLADKLEVWLKALRKHAYGEAINGRVPDGYKIVAKRATRQWKDPDAVMDVAALAFDLPAEDLYVRKPISPAALEKILSRSKEVRQFTDDMAESVSSGVRLAKESAPGEAITAGALADFGDITDDTDF